MAHKTIRKHGLSILSFAIKVMGYSLLLRMCSVVYSQQWNVYATLASIFLAEATLDSTSILQRKRLDTFYELFVRYCTFYLPDRCENHMACGMDDHRSLVFPIENLPWMLVFSV